MVPSRWRFDRRASRCGRAVRAAVLVLLATIGVSTAGAAEPDRVADIQPQPWPVSGGTPSGPSIVQMTDFGEEVLFLTRQDHDVPFSFDRRVEVGLWRTDGTLVGTRLLRVVAGIAEFSYGFVREQAGRYLLRAGDQLWATDGTPEGTVPLLPAGKQFRFLTDYDSERAASGPFTFLACDENGRFCAPWSTDGTPAGTSSLGDVPAPARSYDRVVALGGRLYWLAGGALVTTDGTPAGTRVVIDLGVESRARELVATSDRLFFLLGERVVSLWSSDGSGEGTKVVRRMGTTPWGLVGTTHRLYFRLPYGDGRASLGTSDGTSAGTLVLTRAFGGGGSSYGLALVGSLGDRLLFTGEGGALWATDGTRAGTRRVTGCPGGCPVEVAYRAAVAGEALLVLARRADVGRELWRSDGTGAGTLLVADLCPGACDSHGETVREERLDGRTVIERWNGPTRELWVSDLTPAGTRRLVSGGSLLAAALDGGLLVASTDLDDHRLRLRRFDAAGSLVETFRLPFAESRGSSPTGLVALGERVVFTACDAAGSAPFVSDGTPEGTLRLGPGADYCSGYRVGSFVRFGEAVYYTVDRRLHRTDGTPQGTAPVGLDFPVWKTWVFGERMVLVTADDLDDNGYNDVARLYFSDGTAAGTQPVATPTFHEVCTARAVGRRLYFTGSTPDPADGWVGGFFVLDADTASVTRLLTLDRYHQCGGDELSAIGERVFLSTGRLWRTEGTRESTQLLLPSTLSTAERITSPLASFGGHLYFLARLADDDTGAATFLYRSNGTALGTVPLAAVGNLDYDKTPPGFTVVGARLFFRASDREHGDELWSTDGTTVGTRLVADVAPGVASSRPLPLGAAGGRLYFMADDGEHGVELWSTDGSAAGTGMVADLAPGGFSSWPADLCVAGDRLFFAADDSRAGAELWALPLQP